MKLMNNENLTGGLFMTTSQSFFFKLIETEKVVTVVDSRKTTEEAFQQVRGKGKFICY